MLRPNFSAIALVAKAPRIAQTVTVTGPEMSWWTAGGPRDFAKRVQSLCRIHAPVHDPATADTACNMRKERSEVEMALLGGRGLTPPFAADAQMNIPNIVHVVEMSDMPSTGCSLDG